MIHTTISAGVCGLSPGAWPCLHLIDAINRLRGRRNRMRRGFLMKNNSLLAMTLLAVALFCAGCTRSGASKGYGEGATPAALVTFVELGSVGCIPCKMMQPVMREIETEYTGQVNVVFHDVWTEEGAPYAKEFKIRVIPTQVFLDAQGVEFFRHEGFFPKEQLVKVLKSKGVK
jgi:thiol-disulfide isomerase/thioredoxin